MNPVATDAISFLGQEVTDMLRSFVWPLTRISGAMMTMPLISAAAASIRLRFVLAASLGWIAYPLMDWPTLEPLSAPGAVAIVSEAMIGIAMGLWLQIVVAALTTGGQALSSSIGLSMSNLLDPALGNVPVLAEFLSVLGTMLFLALGGHLLFAGILVDSFRALPPGQDVALSALLGGLLQWSAMAFLGALLVALPAMSAMLLLNVALGFVARATPSLNLFVLGVPAMLIAGLLSLVVSVPSMVGVTSTLWMQALQRLRDVLGIG
jgi:flagellar biosynthetic protein FliR